MTVLSLREIVLYAVQIKYHNLYLPAALHAVQRAGI